MSRANRRLRREFKGYSLGPMLERKRPSLCLAGRLLLVGLLVVIFINVSRVAN